MVSRGHSGLPTYLSSIQQIKSWLGASPEAKVVDPICNSPNCITEFKCLYSKRDKSPQESCDDPAFYCSWENGHLSLK